MSTNMQNAQDLLFGKDGLRASNFKMYPGTDSDINSEAVALEIANAITDLSTRLAAGELQEEVLA